MAKYKSEPQPAKYDAVNQLQRQRQGDYRPGQLYATVEEAKALLRKRYTSRGFEVNRVSRYDKYWFTISFPERQGPRRLPAVFANWPYRDDAPTAQDAHNAMCKVAGIEKPQGVKSGRKKTR